MKFKTDHFPHVIGTNKKSEKHIAYNNETPKEKFSFTEKKLEFIAIAVLVVVIIENVSIIWYMYF
jgi:hypothetical protein